MSLKVDGPVALTGRTSNGVSLENAQISVWARANEGVLEKLRVGDTVPRFKLPKKSTTAKGSEFAVVLDRAALGKDYIWDGGIVNLEVEVYDPVSNKLSFTAASVRPLDAKGGSASWVDPLDAPEDATRARSTHNLKPVLLDVKMHEAPAVLARQAQGTSGQLADGCDKEELLGSKAVWADIGETYPVDDGLGGFKFSGEATATYGIAAKWAGWEISGSQSLTSGHTFEWPVIGPTVNAESGKPRKYQVEVTYDHVNCYSVVDEHGNVSVLEMWKPRGHAGGSRTTVLPQPSWADGNTSRCSQVSSPLWNKHAAAGSEVQAAWESPSSILGADLGIGINVSVKREWSTESTLYYKMTDGANWLCGVDDKPGPASKVAQYSKAKQRSCDYQTPVVSGVQKDAAPEAAFNNYAKSTANGWTGGDSTYSTMLPNGKRLWMFSDTWLGPLKADGKRPLDAPLVNQSFVVQDGNSMSTITGGSSGSPQALRPPPSPLEWYWLGDGTIGEVDGKERLQIIFHRWERYAPWGVWDFRVAGIEVSTFDLNNLSSPISSKKLSNDPAYIQWGSGILPSTESGDGYTYIYGVLDAPTNKSMRVARVKGRDISNVDHWMYYDPLREAWSTDEQRAGEVAYGVSNEYSVSRWNDQFVLISQDTTQAFSRNIGLWSSCAPWGNGATSTGFKFHEFFYQTPETGLWGSYEDENVFTYNAHAHPSLRSGGQWTLSYNVNTFDTTIGEDGAHYRDPSIYRPRFVSFNLSAGTAARTSGSFTDDGRAPGVDSAGKSCGPRFCMGVPR
ncbi:hypothetical protein [Streptomyces exfoliatus]|uniref:hypothetical protein n=1 Tax=Streptomyces exfoliatus TaxID=1905 RepID=UPI003794FE57